jgi:oxygen-independent coproporphyrinogen-3 oxidase
VALLLDTLRAVLDIAPAAELTIEANPEDVDDANVAAWKAAGVNRVSLGIQSFSNPALSWMHRVHDADQASHALALLASQFDRVSADIIFALPRGVKRNLAEDVGILLQSGVGHISLYGLTSEPLTPLARWVTRGEIVEAPEEQYECEFLWIHETLESAGFRHYEVSSFARGDERARHNSAYWSGAAYIGVGPAAHGYDGTLRRWNIANYTDWARAVAESGDPLAGSEELTPGNRVAEEVYLGLRVSDGLPLRAVEVELVEPWVRMGWAWVEGSRLKLSPLGWLRLDSLAASLTAHRSR